MTPPFHTIGHSNLGLEAFVGLLEAAGIELLVDIRTVPRSRANPQFNQDALPASLDGRGIAYEHLAALGGLRPRSRTVPREVNGYWDNDSFHNYADYALSQAFHAGLDHLVARGRALRSAVMCSEAVWWRCHRRIVADHLLARGETVLHIMAAGRIEPASLTPGARVRPDGMVVYPGADAAGRPPMP
ncbi:DUF488 domain-containing protein [Bordetella genomosp. 6]|uniref:DUF488 domain-containing protein n=1 Tax=Bordetella genomosp. 6 TaxID=463024 RepID=UPI000A29093C|nr:DUF488 domain-containing protein [Bordetella genomosp. 6]ARP76823.1 DNA repair protein [Bordetella genomosp. 6]